MALFLGVLVVGLGIGAALSLLGRSRNAPATPVVDVATNAPATDVPATDSPSSTPPGVASPAPVATTRAVPTPRRERPSVVPSLASATSSPAANATATAIASPVTTAATTVRITAVPATVPSPAKVALVPSAAPLDDRRTPAAATLRTAPTAEAAQPAAPAQTVAPEPPVSAFSHASAAVVRQFLQSLIDGDETTARDTLVDGKADLPEAAIVDRDSRVRNVVAHGTGDTAEVTVVIETPGGNYAGRYYLVKSGAGNPQIRAHDIARL